MNGTNAVRYRAIATPRVIPMELEISNEKAANGARAIRARLRIRVVDASCLIAQPKQSTRLGICDARLSNDRAARSAVACGSRVAQGKT